MKTLPISLTLGAVALAGCGASSHTTAGTAPAAKKATGPEDVSVRATEFGFTPSTLHVHPGPVHLTLHNTGKMTHELVVLRTPDSPGALPVNHKGRVSEKASVGEIAETPAGATRSATLKLSPGRYVIVCNVPGHYSDGMHGEITVS